MFTMCIIALQFIFTFPFLFVISTQNGLVFVWIWSRDPMASEFVNVCGGLGSRQILRLPA